MRVWVLGSGSEGNAAFIECGDTRVLVDAGFSPREIARRLRSIDVEPASIAACVVTHGHLSNRAAAAFTRDLVHRDLAHVILAHMSERCNDHGVAQRSMANALRTTRFRGATHLTMQHGVVGPFTPSASRVEPPRQLLLA